MDYNPMFSPDHS
jgi:hypothetical protein